MLTQSDVIILARAVGSGHELLGIALAVLIYVVAAWGEWPVPSLLRRHTRRTDLRQPTLTEVPR